MATARTRTRWNFTTKTRAFQRLTPASMGRGKRSCTAETQTDTERDIKYLRKLRLPQEFIALGLDGFVRGVVGRRSKQLFDRETAHLFWTKSLCPGSRPQAVVPVVSEVCGCHRGDQDCPLQCPERDATTPICPRASTEDFSARCQDEFSPELCCPRHPRAYGFDVGFSSVGLMGTARAAAAGE